MSSKEETKETKAKKAKKPSKSDARAKKLEEKRTAKVSRERLKRISNAKKHHLRNTRRVIKYGTKSFVRNTWLSIAAVAIMSITLIVLSATVIATDILRTAKREFESKVDFSIYIKQTASRTEVSGIAERLRKLPSVTKVNVVSPNEASDKTIEMITSDENIVDEEVIKELQNAPIILPWTINVTLISIDDTDELKDFVDNDESMRGMLDAKRPTYETKDREAIDNIAKVMKQIEVIGFAAAGVFAIIAILVVFNTIRMAIYNRKEEIQMMHLVGASNSFIVGPFLVEASLYGIVAAIVAIAASYGSIYGLCQSQEFLSLVQPTFDVMTKYWYFVACALAGTGVLIGVISARLAARKYIRNN